MTRLPPVNDPQPCPPCAAGGHLHCDRMVEVTSATGLTTDYEPCPCREAGHGESDQP